VITPTSPYQPFQIRILNAGIMALFDKSDLHFVVFFPVDKTAHIMAKNRVEFKDDEGSVVVMWQTSDLEDDGKMVLKEMPYNGHVVFSGSKFIVLLIYEFIKCFNFYMCLTIKQMIINF
jgi:hypothetical protein